MVGMLFLKNMLNDSFIIVKQELKLATGLMFKLILQINNITPD
jgi:hypothetical protein